jgi:transaldolase
MFRKTFVELLLDTNPEMEMWWDSSPLDFRSWATDLLRNLDGHEREAAEACLNQFSNLKNFEQSLIKGITTNPRLITKTILGNQQYWRPIVRRLADRNPGIDRKTLARLVYARVIKLGAIKVLPMWQRSDGRFGWHSAQVDPRFTFNADAMMEHALELAALAPNIMVKVPGSAEGYEVIRRLTSLGIATNGTFSYTVPQILACVRAVEGGLMEARHRGTPLRTWRSVITHMIGRFGRQGDLVEQAERRGLRLTVADIRWAELAILKRAYRVIEDGKHPTKLLLSSMIVDEALPPEQRCWHMQKTSGAAIAYTCPPEFLQKLFSVDSGMPNPSRHAMDEPPPREVMERLLTIPYFVRSLEPDGIPDSDFVHQAAFIATLYWRRGNLSISSKAKSASVQ